MSRSEDFRPNQHSILPKNAKLRIMLDDFHISWYFFSPLLTDS